MTIWVDEFMELCSFHVVSMGESELRPVPVDRIRARKGHEELDEENVKQKALEGIKDPPYLAEYGDELFYVINGHHRVAAAVVRKQKTILAFVYQSEKPEPGETMDDVWHRATYGRNSCVKMEE